MEKLKQKKKVDGGDDDYRCEDDIVTVKGVHSRSENAWVLPQRCCVPAP